MKRLASIAHEGYQNNNAFKCQQIYIDWPYRRSEKAKYDQLGWRIPRQKTHSGPYNKIDISKTEILHISVIKKIF